MKFFGREEEIAELRRIRELAKDTSRFTVLTGRRRVGKTELEVKMFGELRDLVERDYDVFTGIALEGYFRTKFIEERKYSRIGGWWNRKGEMEIDLVCDNEFKNQLDFYEVKRYGKRINLAVLERKVQAFFEKNPLLAERKYTLAGLSMDDM